MVKDKALELLREYAKQHATIPRGTSDLSHLEEWLLYKLAKAEIFFDGVRVVVEPPSFYYNSTETISNASVKFTFNDKSVEILKDVKGVGSKLWNK
jgi:hypothetical protein